MDTETNSKGEKQEEGEAKSDAADAAEQQGAAKPDISGDDRLLMMNADNLPKEVFEQSDEMKALTQEVIKTIRDIIVSVEKKCRNPFMNTIAFVSGT